MEQKTLVHVPVLLNTSDSCLSVLGVLQPRIGEKVLDVTLGLGGHSRAFLEAIGSSGFLTALDADDKNLEEARSRLTSFTDTIELLHRNFGEAASLLPRTFDVIFADLGLSSPHVDDAERGFSFRSTAPLDMRYDRTKGRPASVMLSRRSAKDITALLRTYGDVSRAGSLAKCIADTFHDGDPSLKTTDDLRKCVDETFGYKAPSVLPQVFQAVRIAVNNEMGVLERFLGAVPSLLTPGGRCGIISYHSLEDRMVKQAFRSWCSVPKDETTGQDLRKPDFVPLTKKAIVPDETEVASNPRSRSAKFRVVKKSPDTSITEQVVAE